LSLVFGKYEKIRRIAQGGMGEVFLARQTGVLDRLAILKSLRADLASEREFVDQFLDEARVAATLNHPNIVSIYDVGEWNGTYYIAMEYVPGEDLSKLWYAAAKAGVGLPFQVSVRICCDAALGLDHAHKARDMRGRPLNIVHRDVSPQNIMVRGDGVVKLVDFGIAKAANKSSRTQAGMVKGKLQYMSPEQVRGEALDGRSDQFSLGVVLWEMCTGRRLFKADTEINTLQKILQAPIPKPSEHVPGFPPELEATILRMLQRDVDKRFKTLGDAATELKAYLDRSALTGGDTTVASFVQQILGKELEERVRDLTPMEATEAGVPYPTKRPAANADRDAKVNSGANVVQKPKVSPNDQATVIMPEEDVARPAPSSASGDWSVKRADGSTLSFTEMSVLHQWILDGEVGPDDAISADGKTWKRLKDAPQFTKFLEIAAAAKALAKQKPGMAPGVPQPPAQNTVTKPMAAAGNADGVETPTLQLGSPDAAGETGQFSLGELPQSLTGTWGAPEIAAAVAGVKKAQEDAAAAEGDGPATLENAAPRTSRVPTFVWMLGGIAVALSLVVAGLAFFAPDLLRTLVSPPAEVAEVKKAISASKNDDAAAIAALLKPALARAQAPEATAADVAAAAILQLARARIDDETVRIQKLAAQVADKPAPPTSLPDPAAARAAAAELATRAATLDAGAQATLLAAALVAVDSGAPDEDPSVKALLDAVKGRPLEVDARAELDAARVVASARQAFETAKDAAALRAASEKLTSDDPRVRGVVRVLHAATAVVAAPAERAAAVDALRADVKTLPDASEARWDALRVVLRRVEKKLEDKPAAVVDAGPAPGTAADAGPTNVATPTPAVVDTGPPEPPETFESALEKAKKAQKAGKVRDALRMAKKALELKPGAIEAQLIVGWGNLEAGSGPSLENAARQFSVILKKEAGNCEAQMGLATALDRLGQTENARKEYQAYVDKCPGGPEVEAAKGAIQRLE
jgi:serine/threonine-protein kinase